MIEIKEEIVPMAQLTPKCFKKVQEKTKQQSAICKKKYSQGKAGNRGLNRFKYVQLIILEIYWVFGL